MQVSHLRSFRSCFTCQQVQFTRSEGGLRQPQQLSGMHMACSVAELQILLFQLHLPLLLPQYYAS